MIPSLSTQAQASAGDVQRLVDQIERERVEAVFPSPGQPRHRAGDRREAGARIGDRCTPTHSGRRAPGGDLRWRARVGRGSLVRGMSGGRVTARGARGRPRGRRGTRPAASRRACRSSNRTPRQPLDGALELRSSNAETSPQLSHTRWW